MPKGGARANTGGRREGAGRKPEAAKWSEEFKGGLAKALTKKAKESGKNAHEVLVETLYAADTQDAVKVACYKLLQTAFLAVDKAKDDAPLLGGPVILPAHLIHNAEVVELMGRIRPGCVILPELQEDPAKGDNEREALEPEKVPRVV